MLSFRGDAHKFYLKLKNDKQDDLTFPNNPRLVEIRKIQRFYEQIDDSTLKDIYFQMKKEKGGSGIIPIFVSAGPWLLFIFSKQLQQLLFKDGSLLWLIFILAYMSVLILSVTLHFHEKAWATLHIEIIQDILEKRKATK